MCWMESCDGIAAEDVQLASVCPDKHLALKFREWMEKHTKEMMLSKDVRRAKSDYVEPLFLSYGFGPY